MQFLKNQWRCDSADANNSAKAACGDSEDHHECVHVELGEDNNDILTRLGKIFWLARFGMVGGQVRVSALSVGIIMLSLIHTLSGEAKTWSELI